MSSSYSDFNYSTHTPDLNYGGDNPPSWALALEGNYTNLHGAKEARPGWNRWCMRFYQRFGHEYVCSVPDDQPGCDHITGKLVDTDGCESGVGIAHQLDIRPSIPVESCGAPGTCGAFGIDTDDNCGNQGGYDFPSLTPDHCRAGADGKGGWCRFEFCIGSDDANDLSQPGARHYEVRIARLDAPRIEETLITESETYSYELDYFLFNSWNNRLEAEGHREVSYYMEAAWPVDSGQWIGPACEIEDRC
jgi:hypothetical protein